MKKLIQLAFCLIAVQQGLAQSVYNCNVYNPLVTQAEIMAVPYEFNKQCILFDQQNYSFSGNLNRMVSAATSIHLKPGVHIGPFTGNGAVVLTIKDQKEFDVAVMNYADLNNVLKFEKLELGITLPADILEKVNNFVNKINIGESEKINPYLDSKIRVYAEFNHPSLSESIVIDGFYTKDYISEIVNTIPTPQNGDSYSDTEYRDLLGGWIEQSSNYPFRVRFAPPKNGVWTAIIKIAIPNEAVLFSDLFKFTVVESGNPGYVSVGDNKRYLKYNNKTFFPVGCNLRWPETDTISDPDLWNHLCYWGVDANNNPTYYKAPEGYRPNFSAPRVYEKYKNVMHQLANGGANYYRSIMYPTSTEIEWEEPGNYTDRLTMAHEMDGILETAEQRDLFVHWNMQIHYTFNYGGTAETYYRGWCWNATPNGDSFCYNGISGVNNPEDFFSNQECKDYYKQRLRYILARWGYSTQIAVWELFSEINNVAKSAQFYDVGNNYQIIRDWQVEMGEYLKSMYHGKIHLVTASYGDYLSKNISDNTFDAACFDVMTTNVYDFKEPTFAKDFIDKVSRKILNQGENEENCFTCNFVKPVIFSEAGPDEEIGYKECTSYIPESRRHMWQSTFSGVAGALAWNMAYHPDYFYVYGQINNFIGDLLLDEERWHPGSMNLFDFAAERQWHYNEDYADNMDGDVNPLNENGGSRLRKADVSYLRSGDGNFVIGVITNKTYNEESSNGCPINAVWTDNANDVLIDSEPINCENEKLKLKGLQTSKYYVNYFLTNNFSVPAHSSDDFGPNVKLEFTVQNTDAAYIAPFKARRKDYNWVDLFYDTAYSNQTVYLSNIENINEDILNINSETSNKFQIYPNPTNGLLTVKIEGLNEILEVIIKSIEGKTMKKEIMSNGSLEFDLSLYECGIYFIEIVQGNHKIHQKKLVKL